VIECRRPARTPNVCVGRATSDRELSSWAPGSPTGGSSVRSALAWRMGEAINVSCPVMALSRVGEFEELGQAEAKGGSLELLHFAWLDAGANSFKEVVEPEFQRPPGR